MTKCHSYIYGSEAITTVPSESVTDIYIQYIEFYTQNKPVTFDYIQLWRNTVCQLSEYQLFIEIINVLDN
jgi:hypothetical protein